VQQAELSLRTSLQNTTGYVLAKEATCLPEQPMRSSTYVVPGTHLHCRPVTPDRAGLGRSKQSMFLPQGVVWQASTSACYWVEWGAGMEQGAGFRKE